MKAGMKRRYGVLIVLGSALAMCVAPSWLVEAAQRAIGASFQDIMSAMGPDALGLDISPDTLPDISNLALSRMNDDQDKFIVENPYTGGRWKGGKAVIEYARDLSYAMISIYDKSGHRQRIYSVTARPPEPSSEQAPPEETLAQREAEQISPDDHHVLVYSSNESEYSPGSGEVARPPQRSRPSTVGVVAARSTAEPSSVTPPARAAVSQKPVIVAKAEPESGGTQASGFVWDDDKQAYVPAGGAVTTGHHRRHKHPSASAEQTSTPEQPTSTEATQVAMTPTPAAGGVVWDDSKQAYVPAGGASSSAAASDESSSTGTHHRRRHKKSSGASEQTPSQPPAAPAGAMVVAMAPQPSAGAVAPPSVVHNESSVWIPKANPTPPAAPPSAAPPATGKGENVPSTEELLGTASPSSSGQAVQASQPAQAVQTPVESGSKKKKRKHEEAPPEQTISAADQALIAQATKAAKEEAPSVAESAVPSTEELVASPGKNTGPDTSESDQWVPKAVKSPKVKEEPVQVAMVPTPSPAAKPYDSTVAKVTPLSPQAAAAESDAWVPRKTALPQADADIKKALAQIRTETPVQSKPAVKISHDINNPEAGVLPVNSFEKFSGPRYGRHREYERRLYFGKKPKSTVQGYDFYVDEVDRKKEIHNVYYYRKGKVPKLVAVEKHDRVTFMGNYDVDKEDKGKISEE